MTSTPVRSQPMPLAPNLTVPAATALAEIALKKPGVTPKPTRFPAIFLSTPQWLNLALGAIGGSLALSLGLGLSTLQSQRAALELFAQDTAPATLTTLRIQDSLAGLDASVANELLLPPGEQLEARQEADDRQKKLANYWIQIAHNLSYGNRELRPITTLQLGLGDYLMAIERARIWHDQGRAAEAFQAYQPGFLTRAFQG